MPTKMGKVGAGYFCQFIVLLLSGAVALVFTVTLHYTSTGLIDIGWFSELNGTEFELDIQPSDFTFYIIPVIYLWQAVWIIYVFISLCRRTRAGAVFINPPVVTPFFLSMFCACMAFNVAHLFLFNNGLLVWSFFVMFLFTSSIYVMLFVHHRNVDLNGRQLVKEHKFDLWAHRILIQNGLALYAGWSSISTILSLTYVFAYGGVMTSTGGNIDQSTASIIGGAFFGFDILLYFFFENFTWERYLRYTYTVWAAFLWAIIGIMTQEFEYGAKTVITFGLLGLTFILFIIKIVLSIWRSHAKPLYMALNPHPEIV